MIPLPKPRGFWDYALFALLIAGMLVLFFWLEASDGVRWADVALAFASSGLLVLAIILARRGEKAAWIKHPTWRVHLAAVLGSLVLMFGAIYADAYLLHRANLTPKRVVHDAVVVIISTVALLSSSLRKFFRARRRAS